MMRFPVPPSRFSRRLAALATLLAIVLIGAACGGDDAAGTGSTPVTTAPATTTAAPTATPTDPPGERVVDLFFLSADGRLAQRVVIAREGEELTTAMAALIEGPREAGLVPALPPGTELLAATLADGVAQVDLNAAFAAGYPSGGTAAELEVLAPIVYTLTSAPGVRAVLITVEGAAPELPGSGFDLAQPLVRADLPAELAS